MSKVVAFGCGSGARELGSAASPSDEMHQNAVP